jgi:hypothetical protein
LIFAQETDLTIQYREPSLTRKVLIRLFDTFWGGKMLKKVGVSLDQQGVVYKMHQTDSPK